MADVCYPLNGIADFENKADGRSAENLRPDSELCSSWDLAPK